MLTLAERVQRWEMTVMVAPDTIDVIIERVRGLLRWNRRITTVSRYLGHDTTPKVTCGLAIDAEQPDGGLDGWQRAGARGITVWLTPGTKEAVSFCACDTDAPEDDVWARYRSKTERPKDMIMVTFTGGMPGDRGPAKSDQILFTRWNSNGAAEETVVAFDYGPGEKALAEADAALLEELARGDGWNSDWDSKRLRALAGRLRQEHRTLAEELAQRRAEAREHRDQAFARLIADRDRQYGPRMIG